MLEISPKDVLGTAQSNAAYCAAEIASIRDQGTGTIEQAIEACNKTLSDLILYRHMKDGHWVDTIYTSSPA